MDKLSKRASAIILFICVALIGFLAYVGYFGLKVGGGQNEYEIKRFSQVINKGLDLQGGASVVEEIQGKASTDDIAKTKQLIELRVNKLGVSETSVVTEGKKIRIDIPGKSDTKDIIDSIGKPGNLTFKDPSGNVLLTGKDVKEAKAYINENGQPEIGLKLNTSGTKKFADATAKFVGQQISINMDDTMLTDPRVDAVITNGSASITGGDLTIDKARSQAAIINAGALPTTVKVVSINTVSPTLGTNVIHLSKVAGLVGISIVMLFMMLYYRVPGLIADIALTLFIVIVLWVFTNFGVTLTLPGIAAFLLTVGMAVDANVLIFERMKEELKSGKSIRSSIDAGFKRAMSSVLDSNMTTFISGAVLFGFGTGEVKGFALTLIIGVAASLITAVFVTRSLVKLAANIGFFNKKWTIGTFGVHDFRRGVK